MYVIAISPRSYLQDPTKTKKSFEAVVGDFSTALSDNQYQGCRSRLVLQK